MYKHPRSNQAEQHQNDHTTIKDAAIRFRPSLRIYLYQTYIFTPPPVPCHEPHVV
jgi:hypothetical protein